MPIIDPFEKKNIVDPFGESQEKDIIEPRNINPYNNDGTISNEEISAAEALVSGAKNLPKSAYNQVVSIYEAITHPKQTWKGLKTLSKDIFKNQMAVAIKDIGFDPEQLKFKEGTILEDIGNTPALDAVIDDLKNTYGSYDNLKNAVANDPARVITDIGLLVAPAAKGVEAIGTAVKLPGVAKAAGAVSKGASLTEPITATIAAGKQAVKTASKLTGNVFKSLTPTGLYKSAVKMSTTLSDAERSRLSQIALDSGIEPTLKGIDKIDSKIFDIDSKIADMIDAAELSGSKMPINDLFKEFKDLHDAAMLTSKPQESIRAIDRIKRSISDANAAIGKGELTPKEVQKLKQNIYKDLEGYYEKVKNSQASVKAQKAVARSAKEYLETILPEIKQLNKADSDLIALRRALERPASRISNRDILGLGMASKVGGGAVLGGATGGGELAALTATGGLVLGVLDDPVFKSKLAIVLNKLQKKGVKINENKAIMALLGEKAITSNTGESE